MDLQAHGSPLSHVQICVLNRRNSRKLLVGVKDDGTICGVENILLPDYMDRVSNMLHDKIHPLVVPNIYSYAIKEKNIIVVEV